jgi:DNA-binding NtrC family response regulator
MNGAPDSVAELLGHSRAMETVRTRIRQIAPASETVLITGECGTGKDLVARALHRGSGRSGAPLVSLNCSQLTGHLIESELFGHERGAFPGADAARAGRLEMADGGTVLFDHVTELSPSPQATLLRVLEDKCFERLGSNQTVPLDVRIMATSSRQLDEEIVAGRLRADLYYRLAVVPLHIPPLRERRADIPELVDHFLRRAADRLHREPYSIEPAALKLLEEYDWPGNVRELDNIITRGSVLSDRDTLTDEGLRPWLSQTRSEAQGMPSLDALNGLKLHEFERLLIESTLAQFDGHRARTAEALGIGIRTLSGKLKQYGQTPGTTRVPRAHVHF